ncbi:hypothetical protein [Halobacillus massiliensis]|nr:hypothetical protein [Halobacillus massiliensis]
MTHTQLYIGLMEDFKEKVGRELKHDEKNFIKWMAEEAYKEIYKVNKAE